MTRTQLDKARVAAARAGADASGMPITLTARAECFLYGHPDPLREAIERVNLYREVGADCLFVPGVTEPRDIATLVRARWDIHSS